MYDDIIIEGVIDADAAPASRFIRRHDGMALHGNNASPWLKGLATAGRSSAPQFEVFQ